MDGRKGIKDIKEEGRQLGRAEKDQGGKTERKEGSKEGRK